MHWDLPGPNRFLDNVVETLDTGKHVLLVLPDPVSGSNPFSPLRRKLRDTGRGDLTYHVVSPESDDAFDVISETLGCERSEVSSERDLFNYDQPHSRVVAFDLTGLDNGRFLTEWNALIARAAEHAQEFSGGHYQLMMMARPDMDLPSEDLYFAHHHWWGVLGPADVDWVIERCLETFPPASVAEHYWVRSLCRGLCFGDTNLVNMLVDEMPATIDDVIELLSRLHEGPVPASTDFSLNGPILVPFGRKKSHPPRDADSRLLWRRGWMDWVHGHGIVVHSAVMVAAGDREGICKRIMMAQQELLLPVVERIRLAIVGWLEINFGPCWLDTLTTGLSVDECLNLQTDIGALAYHLFRKGSAIRHHDFNTVSNLVWQWREIRNGLSHGRFATLNTLDTAWSAYDDFVSRCS